MTVLVKIVWLFGYIGVIYSKRPPPIRQRTTNMSPEVDKLCYKHKGVHKILYNDHCYYHIVLNQKWNSAVELCESMNTHLVHLETTAEQDIIMTRTGTQHVYQHEIWIGLKELSRNEWAWFYKEHLYPVPAVGTRWSSHKVPDSPPPNEVAQTYEKRTWGKVNKEKTLPVVCEDPQPAESFKYCKNHETATFRRGPLSDFHCYYYVGEDSYTYGKGMCEKKATNVLFLETLEEERWLGAELRHTYIRSPVWLGMEQDDVDQWNWRYGHMSIPVTDPRFSSAPITEANAVYCYSSQCADANPDLNWQTKDEKKAAAIICEEDLFPKLISSLLCFRHHLSAIGFYNPVNSHCYYLYPKPETFSVARSVCENHKGHLMFLEHSDEQMFIQDESYAHTLGTSLWLGLKKIDNYWYWIGRGSRKTKVENERWGSTTSNGHFGVTATEGEWKTARMNDQYAYVCEEDLDDDFINYRVCNKFVSWSYPVFNYETKSCYYLLPNNTDWRTARDMCKAEDTYVVHLNSYEETTWLLTLLSDYKMQQQVWIGIVKTAFKQWSWQHTDRLEVTEETNFTKYEYGPRAYITPDEGWRKTLPSGLHGLVCEESLSPEGLSSSKDLNIGGDWNPSETFPVTPIPEGHDTSTPKGHKTTTPEHGRPETPTPEQETAVAKHGGPDTPTPEHETSTLEHGGPETPTPEHETAVAEHGGHDTPKPEHETSTPEHETPTPEHGGPETPTPEHETDVAEHGGPETPTPEHETNVAEHGGPETPTPERETAVAEHGGPETPTPEHETSTLEHGGPETPTPEHETSTPEHETSTPEHETAVADHGGPKTHTPEHETAVAEHGGPEIPTPEGHETSTLEHETPIPESTLIPKYDIPGSIICPQPNQAPTGSIMQTPFVKLNTGKYQSGKEIGVYVKTSNLGCAKRCSLKSSCFLYTRDSVKTCRLYQNHYDPNASVKCGPNLTCYVKNCQYPSM